LPPTSPSPPPRPPLKAELDRITSGRLTKGEYLLARKELEDLNASAGDDDGIGALLLQLRKALNVSSELTASSGEGAYRSGTRTIASGAGFQLSFTPSDTCYIYIFQVDSLNNLDQLLPNSQALREGNPVEGEKTYRIPSGGNYFVLDNNTGRETIYLVASRWPAEDIEELYAKFKGSSVVQERYRYRRELLERIKSRASAMEAGVSGCFYEEFAFLHTER
jgi:hypothetical protein